MQQAGCKLEEDSRTELLMHCYVKARQPDKVLAALQDFIDGGGQVSGSRALADAEQVAWWVADLTGCLVHCQACAHQPAAVPKQSTRLGSAAKDVHPTPAASLPPVCSRTRHHSFGTAGNASGMHISGWRSQPGLHMPLTDRGSAYPDESSAIELHRALKGVCTRQCALHGLGCPARAAFELQSHMQIASTVMPGL